MTSLPQGWVSASVDELAEGGLFCDGDWVESKDQDSSGGVRLTQLADVGVGMFRGRSDRWMREDQAQRLRCTYLRPRDVLIARMPEPLGRACLVPESIGQAVTAVDVAVVRLARPDVDPRYLMWALNSPKVHQAMVSVQSGTTRKRISRKNLGRVHIPLPGIDEQRRIVDLLEDHLSRLDAGDRLLRGVAARASAYQRSRMDSLTEFFAAQHVPLANLVHRIEAGKSFGSSARPAGLDEWGIIKVSAMTWGEFRPSENKLVTDTGRVDQRYEIRPNDILVSRANTTEYVGAPVLVRETRSRLLLSDKSLRLIPRADCLPAYIVRVLGAPRARRQMSLRATGTKDSMRNISQSALLGIEVPWADRDGQAALVAAAADADSEAGQVRVSAELGLVRSGVMRRALLQAAFSGRLTGSSTDTEIVEELASV